MWRNTAEGLFSNSFALKRWEAKELEFKHKIAPLEHKGTYTVIQTNVHTHAHLCSLRGVWPFVFAFVEQTGVNRRFSALGQSGVLPTINQRAHRRMWLNRSPGWWTFSLQTGQRGNKQGGRRVNTDHFKVKFSPFNEHWFKKEIINIKPILF